MFFKPADSKSTYWCQDEKLSSAIKANNLIIQPLDEKSAPVLKTLLQKNKNDDGFIQMSDPVLDGSKLDQILSKRSADKCFVAKNLHDEVIGFVIFGKDSNIGVIDSLGVDASCRSQALSTQDMTQPKRVGSALLLTACNELSIVDKVKKIGVIISDDSSGAFYKKCFFKADKESIEEMWLSIKKDYPSFEKDFLDKSSHLTLKHTIT